MEILKVAEKNQQSAWKILEDTRIISLWENIGADVHIVGSFKSGLMMKNRDIDLHIYTEILDVTESFSVMQRLVENLSIREIHYKNLIDTVEECLEWHVRFEDRVGDTWKLDMIHIRKGSVYDGTVEAVTAAIMKKLTPELRLAILQIKYDIPDGELIPGIEIYQGVFTGGVRSYKELVQWRKTNPLVNGLQWMP